MRGIGWWCFRSGAVRSALFDLASARWGDRDVDEVYGDVRSLGGWAARQRGERDQTVSLARHGPRGGQRAGPEVLGEDHWAVREAADRRGGDGVADTAGEAEVGC